MARIETIQVPKELHPAGGRILKIMYDTKEPPKNYIWAKSDDEYFIWDGKRKDWVPYEFELIKDKCCIQKNCGPSDEEMAEKFEKFKKEVLAAVLKMNQSQDAINIADIRAQLAEFKSIIHNLEEFENYYTKSEVDQKTTELTNLTTALNNSISGLSRRISGLETNLSDILPTVNRLNQIDHSQFITAVDLTEEYDFDPVEYITPSLDGYATEEYVNRAIADKADKSEIPTPYDDTELASRVTALENNGTYDDTALSNRVTVLENKPFDEYLTTEEELVIATGLNDLNDRVTILEENAD